jgi:hypothetical protein
MFSADSTDVVSSHQESHEYGDLHQQQQQQQIQYDPNQYYDPSQQQHYEVDGGHAQEQQQQHIYEQVHQENNLHQVCLKHIVFRFTNTYSIFKIQLNNSNKKISFVATTQWGMIKRSNFMRSKLAFFNFLKN